MMKTPSRLLLALSISLSLNAAAEDKPVWYGEANCRIAALEPHPAGDFVKWSGQCKDGYADGAGVLEWNVWGHGERKLEATLARGEVVGEGTLVDEKGSYVGTFRHGVPHGQGYFKYASEKGLYEGGVAAGLRDGTGIFIDWDRSRYEGEWKGDKRHGHGRATFGLGGSYEGGWKNDRFDGEGTIVYAGSGRTYTGQFRDGHVAGAAAPRLEDRTYELRETDSRSVHKLGQTVLPQTFVPPDKGWADLTGPQRDTMRSYYPALEAGDEPPYPVGGPGTIYKEMLKARDAFSPLKGRLSLYVLVGKDGTPKNVTMIGSPHPKLTQFMSIVTMRQQYKPAACHGEPCEMIYPVVVQFD
jgi:hypothetical protein